MNGNGKKDAAIFIDRKSINRELRKRGLSFNYKGFIEAIKSRYEIVRAAVYDRFSPEEISSEKAKRFVHFLERIVGIKVVDGGLLILAADLVRYLRTYDVAILVSADPRAPYIADSIVQGAGKEVVGITPKSLLETELKLACNEVCDLEGLGATAPYNKSDVEDEENDSNKKVVSMEKDKAKKPQNGKKKKTA